MIIVYVHEQHAKAVSVRSSSLVTLLLRQLISIEVAYWRISPRTQGRGAGGWGEGKLYTHHQNDSSVKAGSGVNYFNLSFTDAEQSQTLSVRCELFQSFIH